MLREPKEVINFALHYLGYQSCSDNPSHYKEVLDLLLKQKPHVKIYASDQIRERFVSGDLRMAMFWDGDSMRTRAENSDITLSFPKEGVTTWADNFAVPIGAKNVENAKTFLNFVMDPENAGIISNFTRYQNGIKGAEKYTDEELFSAPEWNPPKDTKFLFVRNCSPEITGYYDKIWTQILR